MWATLPIRFSPEKRRGHERFLFRSAQSEPRMGHGLCQKIEGKSDSLPLCQNTAENGNSGNHCGEEKGQQKSASGLEHQQ